MKVIMANRKLLTDLKSEEIKRIKNSLTFDNPAYKNAVKYSKKNYISIPQKLFYYKEQSLKLNDGSRKYCLNVPIGFDLSCFDDVEIIEDKRVAKHVEYPDFSLDLRIEQELAGKAYLAEQEKSSNMYYPKSIIQLKTGQGKSILALYLAQKLKQKTLVLVHKSDLVVGWQKDIKFAFDNKVKSGLIKAKKFEIGEQITIATFQTLYRMDEEQQKSLFNEFGLVIHDEQHHCGINMFNMIDKFNSRYKMGLSATPKRADGLDFLFNEFFGGICYIQENSYNEDILPVLVKIKEGKAEYHPYVYKNKVINISSSFLEDYEGALDVELIPYKERPRIPFFKIDSEIVSDRSYMIQVCNDIRKEYKKGRSIIAFFSQKEHIEQYYDFLKHFIPEDEIILYYGNNKTSNEKLIEKAEKRVAKVTLATYAKATEGTNVKAWEVGFFVSSIASEKNVEQAVGRIRRADDNKLKRAILYDYRFSNSYSIRSHGVKRDRVYQRLDFDIEGKKQRNMFSRGFRK